MDGSSRYIIYMCVKPLGQLLHAHAQMVLSQQFSKFFFTGKGNPGKKIFLLQSGLEPGSNALQTTAFATEPMGLWQLWTANLDLILLTAAVSVDYSKRPWPSGISGESQQTQALLGIDLIRIASWMM